MGAQVGDGGCHVVVGAEALPLGGEGVVEATPQADGDLAGGERQAGGRQGPPHHGALGDQHPLGERLRQLEADDRQQGPRPGEREQVVVVVDAAQIAVGDRLRRMHVLAVDQPRAVEEGEDALAALEVVGDPGQVDVIAPAVDELHP